MRQTPEQVASHYPSAVSRCRWQVLEAAGFSEATVWRGEFDGEAHFALKRWPSRVKVDYLRQIHAWVSAAHAAGGEFVPAVLPTLSNDTVQATTDGCWDVTTWMPGRADFRNSATSERLTAACEAVAALHRVWAGLRTSSAPCPGVTRRLLLLDTWATRRHSFEFGGHPELARSLDAVERQIEQCRAKLLPWRTVAVPTFPCHTDLWHDNILFAGDRVTGVIDYGAMKIDSPAVDLARMLGDLVGPHSPRFEDGLNAYHAAGPPVAVPPDLVRVLGETGIVCAVANWHLRLDRRPVPLVLDRFVARINNLVQAMAPE